MSWILLTFLPCAVGCEIWLHFSNSSHGRNIHAGREYNEYEFFASYPTVPIELESVRATQLMNYVYASDVDSHVVVAFGEAMMLNHAANKTVTYNWQEAPAEHFTEDPELFSFSPNFDFTVVRKTVAGDPIFSNYGPSEWFQTRSLNVSDAANKRISLEELEASGHCLSDVFVAKSLLPLAGNGLFAKRKFFTGDSITISPVLMLPGNLRGTLLANYCFEHHTLDILMLPIGLAAMANHHYRPNMVIRSLQSYGGRISDFDARRSLNRSSTTISIWDLMNAPFAQFDWLYEAARDIEIGEELFIDYGSKWASQWLEFVGQKLEFLLQSEEENEMDTDDGEGSKRSEFQRKFRAVMGFPKSLD